MASTCSVLIGQLIATSACFLGVAFTLAKSILTSPDLWAFSRARSVFASLVIGTLACVVYLGATLHYYVNPADYIPVNYVQGWTWCLYSFCLYTILMERALAVHGKIINPNYVQWYRYGLPFILNLPQFIYVFGGLAVATQAVIATGVFLIIFSNILLSFSFIQTLATYRKKGIIQYIRDNRKDCAMIIANFIVALGFFIIKCFGTAIPYNQQARMFSLFHNSFNPIVVLLILNDYIYVTRHVTKGILATGIEVKNTTGGVANVNDHKTFAKTGTAAISSA
ncbi:hypothetical protein BKA69DRAFT_1108475 [Paraphysoderma sedebokerense]|nr:hypothetical protein BKA69DRAFT_1108475 [Paraphysoderma sedebokerense]